MSLRRKVIYNESIIDNLTDQSNIEETNRMHMKSIKKWFISFSLYFRNLFNIINIFKMVLIIILLICVIDSYMGKYKISINPLTMIFYGESLNKINALQKKFENGQNFIRNNAANAVCSDDKYMNNLQNLSKSTFLTLLGDSYNLNYLRSALVWVYKIRKLHENNAIHITLIIDSLTLSNYDNYYNGDRIIKWFKFVGATDIIILNETNLLKNINAKKIYWTNIYTKLILFNPDFINFTQIAYFDADNFPLQSMYELFNIPCGYTLGATNDLYNYDSLNAGFLIIRPNKIIYDALIAAYKLEINYYKTGNTEQQMIRDLYNGHNKVYNTYWYKFPYEYNTPYWGTNLKHLNGGYKRQKNIHNKIWKYYGYQPQYKIIWDNTWNTVWELLQNNMLTQNMFDLNKCAHKNYVNRNGLCTKHMITK